MTVNGNFEEIIRSQLEAEDSMTYLMQFGFPFYQQSWQLHAEEVWDDDERKLDAIAVETARTSNGKDVTNVHDFPQYEAKIGN